ncbi:MAG TPA: PilT/PilU family type 4a pilus ATPase [Gemmatimonadales bacterium]|nr:PilT/PilU family type 4a pilus ATPase [Gemmatimonadales bacterium]
MAQETASSGIEKIIRAAVERGASDLHIKAGDVFRARVNGKLVPLTKQRLTPAQTRAIALRLLPDDSAREILESLRDYDCSWGMPGVGRFRVNLLRQRSSVMIVMRVIPFAVPTLEQLGLPAVLTRVAEAERGLVLVTGVTGSGKSSTIAALVHHINQHLSKHIVSLENPIEFLHRDINCSVTQREVGVDTASVEVGLRASLRQDPDVIVLGDLRDPATVDLAIKAAEEGHLVIAAMPTPDVASTLQRLFSVFPPEEREIGRVRVSEALRAVVAQRLIPRKDGEGRVPAVEVLVATPRIREILRDPVRFDDLKIEMIRGRDDVGTQTFGQHLDDLVAAGAVAAETARAALTTDPDVEARVSGGRAGVGGS